MAETEARMCIVCGGKPPREGYQTCERCKSIHVIEIEIPRKPGETKPRPLIEVFDGGKGNKR